MALLVFPGGASASSSQFSVTSGPAYRHCATAGFHGELRFWYVYNGEYVRYVGRIEYRINKGTESGGNEANIWWGDHAGPGIQTDAAIQDNQWHTFGGDYYRSSRAEVDLTFQFDRSWPIPDPYCTVSWFM
ncbi:hypothetical protein [Actinophytocola sp.]|uniref:hypothetical protein n=1 Tax=Actinophytocola sp. TaxID=1872138 RepID=UPI003D6A04F1